MVLHDGTSHNLIMLFSADYAENTAIISAKYDWPLFDQYRRRILVSVRGTRTEAEFLIFRSNSETNHWKSGGRIWDILYCELLIPSQNLHYSVVDDFG